jgi:alanine-glyoxylate transaminase/serine-glyoxylate transaminase/serine-pyruvate transaminase
MIEEETLEARWERHRVLADGVRAAVAAWSSDDGLGFLAVDPAQRSHSVTTITTGAVDSIELARISRERLGVTLWVGIGDFASTSFRSGHMGHVNAAMVLGVLGTIEAALLEMDAPLCGSGAAAAAAAIARSACTSDDRRASDSLPMGVTHVRRSRFPAVPGLS